MSGRLESRLRSAFDAAVEYWLPDRIRGPGGDPHRRARLVVCLAWIIVFCSLLSGIIRARVGQFALLFPLACVLGCIGFGLFRLKRSGNPSVLAHIVTGSATLSITVLNIASAASLPGPVYTSLLIPLIAVLMLGPIGGGVWGAFSMLQLAVALGLRISGHPMWIEPDPALVSAAEVAAPLICTAAILWGTLTYEGLKSSALRELAIARDEAQEASRAKTQFLANTSHELRTPMNGVLGIAQLIENRTLDPEQRKLVKRLRQSASLLLLLLNDLIDAARTEYRDLELRVEWVNLGRAVRDVFELLEPEARRKGLRFEALANVELELETDGGRLRQILVNLISNALKFTHEGSIRVVAEASPREAENYEVRIRVEDTGVGIPRASLERIFERFTQADPTTRRRYGGAGLGLTISRDIAECMGGRLTVESRVGQGSRFECVFSCPGRPAAPPCDDASERRHPSLDLDVLVAEDNSTNLVVIQGFLEILGCRCIPAGNGREALERFLDSHCDLVLLDCQMPELDGYQVARSIREIESESAQRRIPLIAVTANVGPGERGRCREAGMDDLLAKPFSLDQLADCMRAVLAPHEGSDPERAGVGARRRRRPRAADAATCLHRLSEAGEDFARRVVEGWRMESEQALRELWSAVQQGNLRAVERLAHARIGASLGVGAESLAANLGKLESLARQGRTQDLTECLVACEAAFAVESEALAAELQNPS